MISKNIKENKYSEAENNIYSKLYEKLNIALEQKKDEIASSIKLGEGAVKDFIQKDMERTGKDLKKVGQKVFKHRADSKDEIEKKAAARKAKAEVKKSKIELKKKKLDAKAAKIDSKTASKNNSASSE